MVSHFFGRNKYFWSFSTSDNVELKESISKVSGSVLKKIIDYSFEECMELHHLPNIDFPCLFIKTPQSTWYYLNSEEEAEEFQKNLNLDKNYPYCQFL
jgi:hypothetical protein